MVNLYRHRLHNYQCLLFRQELFNLFTACSVAVNDAPSSSFKSTKISARFEGGKNCCGTILNMSTDSTKSPPLLQSRFYGRSHKTRPFSENVNRNSIDKDRNGGPVKWPQFAVAVLVILAHKRTYQGA